MVRVWCVAVSELDRQHLLGEHAELHCIVGALSGKYKPFRDHPETLRFKDRIDQLYFRHGEQVKEMQKRGYTHESAAEQQPPVRLHEGRVQSRPCELAKRQRRKG